MRDQLTEQLEGFPIPYFAAQLRMLLARIGEEDGELDVARTQLGDALEIARSLDNPWLIGDIFRESWFLLMNSLKVRLVEK